MRLLTLTALAFVFLVVQSSVLLPGQGIFVVRPDLELLLVIFWGLVFGPGQGLAAAAISGLFLDTVSAMPLGSHVVALASVVLLLVVTEQGIVVNRLVHSLLLVVLGTLIYYFILGLVLQLGGRQFDWVGSIVWIVAPAMVFNLALSPLFYFGLNALGARFGSSRAGHSLQRLG